MPIAPVMILGSEGYIGSALTAHLQAASMEVHSVDSAIPRGSGRKLMQCKSYQDLSREELEKFGTVVLLAGHSSVAACERSPVAAFANNVLGFVDLVHKLRTQKLIFASSISVYVNTDGRPVSESEPLPNPATYYDLHKQSIERYAALSYFNSFGLRFGTICGPSANIRSELLLNSMVRSAVQEHHIQVANCHVNRPLLGITDCCRAIEVLITGNIKPGSYNLASVNVRIGDVAEQVAGRFHVPSLEVERENSYDIRVDTRKFCDATGMVFQDSLETLIEDLHAYYSCCPDLVSSSDGL